MMDAKPRQIAFGMIVGNRGFFPDHLAQSGRTEMIAAIAQAVCCAELFKNHSDGIDGVIVTLPNFGDERAIADTLRMAGLNVPVLMQASPDTPNRMGIRDRRDSFCGKMSACNNLSQYG